MIQKFLTSRKLWVAVLAFITVNVLPNLPAETQARYSALIAAAYVLAQGLADAFGSNPVPSQGMPVEPPPAPPAPPAE